MTLRVVWKLVAETLAEWNWERVISDDDGKWIADRRTLDFFR
ncbi:MAG: hypothetical protein AB1756_01905 [Acidobacteriota bacterium]